MNYHKILISGKVQGVGFRPCVYKVAKQLELKGYVKNLGNEVEILINQDLELFLSHLRNNLPLQANIVNIHTEDFSVEKKYNDFFILESENKKPSLQGILPQDLKICNQCLKDIEENKFYLNYPFTTCTDCGPRYSIIQSLPYDRKNTTMRDFSLCSKCQDDFINPNNRRFHAQPLSCNICAIPMTFHMQNQKFSNYLALEMCAKSILEGKIVAIKGVGGFALVCDATNSSTINRLRDLKQRPYKPFAVMVKDLEMAHTMAHIDSIESKALQSKEAPIVLLRKKQSFETIAPQIPTIGLILPYSGLHYILLKLINKPIIFTSANLSGEMIISNDHELKEKLGDIFDSFLTYEREIANPIDDSVVQKVGNKIQIMRLARGYAPLHLHVPQLNQEEDIIIGMGAEQKVTLSYRQGKEIVISPFMGDLNNLSTLKNYEKTLRLFESLYQLKPNKIMSDKHPNYHSYSISDNFSKNNPILWEKKQHHYAHFCAIFIDAMLQDSSLMPQDTCLGVIWDGTGLGEDNKIWGSEFILGNLASYKRIGHLKEMQIYGGEKSIKEIYKIAYSLVKQFCSPEIVDKIKEKYTEKYPHIFPTFDLIIDKKLQYFTTTSMGRIFDAIACLCEICDLNTYDAQAPIVMEQYYDKNITEYYPFLILEDGSIDLKDMFQTLINEVFNNHEKNVIITKFFNTLVEIIFNMTTITSAKVLMFSGGVFMNKTLCEIIMQKFSNSEIKLFFHHFLPSNDSNISVGQVI